MNTLSIVIPTYNRCGTLEKAIRAYQKQSALGAITEILVVDDGSTDSTTAIVAKLAEDSSVPIRYSRQENKGPAAARNIGIREAKGESILFTDDDIIPGPDLVAEHLKWHQRSPELPVAVLGYVTWAPEVNPTPFMNWYGSKGPLFKYAQIEGLTDIDYRYLYTCNISFKAEFLRRNGTFDEDFPVAAYEDVELGYRLGKAGLRLLYNRKAVGYHQQYVSFGDACRRTEKVTLGWEVLKHKKAASELSQYHKPGKGTLRKGALNILKRAAPILAPLKGHMDGPTPLPASFYKLMLRVFQHEPASSTTQ